MNDLTTTTAAGLPADLGWSIRDVITKDELQSMPLGMRIDFVPELRAHFENMARDMAGSELTRDHLKEKPTECLSVIKNALNWGMDPRAVAGKTYAPGKGQIGIEGVLASAIILRSGRAKDIRYEYGGDWSKVTGKWAKEQATWPDGNPKFSKFTDKQGKKTPIMTVVSKWKPEDEVGLWVKAIATRPDGTETETPEIYLNECHPRNALTWPTAPKRQIIHVAERVLCNQLCGDILMGVHMDVGLTRHFEEQPDPEPKDVTPKASAEDMVSDIKGNGPTEPMQAGGYSDVDPETGEVTREALDVGELSDEDLDKIQNSRHPDETPKPARKRVKLTLRGKVVYKTHLLRDVKHAISKETDPGALETLQDDVHQACSLLDAQDGFPINEELDPIFDAKFDELDGEDGDEVEGDVSDTDSPFDGIDLAGDED